MAAVARQLRWIKAAAEGLCFLKLSFQPSNGRTIGTMLKNNTEPGRPKPTVLVVDDDRAVRNSLKFLLELEGFPVRLYAGGEELLKEENLPKDGCLVIDQVMPGMSGLEIVDEIRQRGGRNPAVLIVSSPNVKVRKGAETRGIAVVEKPFLEHALVDAIHHATAAHT
jgi:FixJ family two-component response regulator